MLVLAGSFSYTCRVSFSEESLLTLPMLLSVGRAGNFSVQPRMHARP